MLEFTEENDEQLTIVFRDELGALAVPASARYRIDDQETGQEILDWTALAAASSQTIVVTEAQNEMIDTDANDETHILTIEVTSLHVPARKTKDEFPILVRALAFVPHD